jgi:hypothetical protein
MTHFNLLSRRRDRSTHRGRNRRRTRLALEPLDDRLLPSTFPVLNPGQNLYVATGDTVQSPNGYFELGFSSKGDLIEMPNPNPTGDQVVWDAHTSGTFDAYSSLQLDGDLVFHDGRGNVVDISNTSGHPGDVLWVQDDGNVVIYDPDGTPIWSTNTAGAGAALFLTPGQSVYSPNGHFSLTLDSGGNLAEYGSYGHQVWASGTNGTPVIEAILQTDGNLVLYGPANADGSAHSVWSSNTSGYPQDVLRVQDDGNVVIYDAVGNPIWTTNTAGADASLYLTPGQSVSSPNGQFVLILESGGDLVEFGPSGDKVWDSGTDGKPVIEAILQTDGNLVLYGPNIYGYANPVWASNTPSNEGDVLKVQDDGNIVLYDSIGFPIWATNTAGADAGLYLTPGQSYNFGAFQLTLTTDGDLVEYGPFGREVWDSGATGLFVTEAILQTDGNLVLYGPANADGSANPVWASNTNGYQGDTIQADFDGVWIYDQYGNPIWHNGSRV